MKVALANCTEPRSLNEPMNVKAGTTVEEEGATAGAEAGTETEVDSGGGGVYSGGGA